MMNKLSVLLLCVVLSLSSGSVFGVDRIRVMALFPNMAMVSVDGTQRLLKAGKTSPEGITLISADSRQAVIEVHGARQTYELGTHIQTTFSKPETTEAQIWRDESGSYTTLGSINGHSVNMLVDTGASAVAMNAIEAKRLGVRYRMNGQKVMVDTASGRAKGYAVNLERIKVGGIDLYNVGAVVVEGSYPKDILLGMTFLNRVTMEDKGKVLILRTRF